MIFERSLIPACISLQIEHWPFVTMYVIKQRRTFAAKDAIIYFEATLPQRAYSRPKAIAVCCFQKTKHNRSLHKYLLIKFLCDQGLFKHYVIIILKSQTDFLRTEATTTACGKKATISLNSHNPLFTARCCHAIIASAQGHQALEVTDDYVI